MLQQEDVRIDAMNWDAIGAIGEFAGAIAVVISLLFVAFSIKRNTMALSGQGLNELYDGVREIDLIVFADPDLIKILETDASAVADLPEEDRLRYRQYVILILDVWERAIYRQIEGLIDERYLVGWHEYFGNFVRRHLSEEMWNEVRWIWELPELHRRVEDALNAQ